MDAGSIAAIVLGCFVPIAGFLGFFITKKLIEKQLRDNPPFSEKQIRAMFLAMGRKPSESQIKSVMNSIRQKDKPSYSKKRK